MNDSCRLQICRSARCSTPKRTGGYKLKQQQQQHAAWFTLNSSPRSLMGGWLQLQSHFDSVNQVTGSGFIRWLQPSWQTARWAGRTNGHWFFNKGPETVSQPGYGDIFSRGDGLLSMMAWLAHDHRPPHQPHTFPWLCLMTLHWC